VCLFRAGLVTEGILVGFVALLPIGRVAKGATRKGMHEQQQQQQQEKEREKCYNFNVSVLPQASRDIYLVLYQAPSLLALHRRGKQAEVYLINSAGSPVVEREGGV